MHTHTCMYILQASATNIVQSKWFEVAGQRNSDIDSVHTIISYLLNNFSSDLLRYIINLTDGNVSLQLSHYYLCIITSHRE